MAFTIHPMTLAATSGVGAAEQAADAAITQGRQELVDSITTASIAPISASLLLSTTPERAACLIVAYTVFSGALSLKRRMRCPQFLSKLDHEAVITYDKPAPSLQNFEM